MKRFMILGPSLLIILFIACENKQDDHDDIMDNSITVTTSDVNESSFYYNLTTAAEDTNTWHLSLQNISVEGGYYMPSIILDSSVMVVVDNSVSYEELETIPENDQWLTSIGTVSYGGDNEVLSYHFATHTIRVSTNNYLIYVTTTHQVFKLHFDDYSSGVVQFRFAEMTE